MAISVVGKGATGSTAASTLAISPAATSGNYLCCFIETATENIKPTSVTDDLGGTWTIEATSGEATSAAVQVWFAWKKAAGNEKEIKVTPAGTSVVHGLFYVEASGVAAEAPEHLVTTGKQASATTHASPEITTSTANDLIVVGFGWGTTAAEVESWNNAMTNVSSAASRVGGGYIVVTGTLAAKVFTATLKAAKAGGGVAVALKPSGAAEVPLQAASSTSAASAAVTAATTVPLNAAASSSAAVGAVTAPPQVPLSPAASSSAASAALTAPTTVPLAPACSASAASAGITAPTTIPLAPAASISSAQGDLLPFGGVLPLQPASSSSAASAGVTAPTTIPLQPAAASSSAQLTSLTAGASTADALVMLV